MRKYIDKIAVLCVVVAVVMTVLFMNGEKLGIKAVVDEDAEMYSSSVYFSSNDLNPDWDDAEATRVELRDDGSKIQGSGVFEYENNVFIGSAGDYALSGSLKNGSVIVDANSSAKIWIRLDGVDLHREDDAAFIVEQADKVFLTLAEGSENRISSGAEYSKDSLDKGINGALFARDDVTINGSGSLTVKAEYRHGISTKDNLVITGGTVKAKAPQDAIHTGDGFRLRSAKVAAEGEDDGVSVTGDDGYFYMESGSLDITSGDDAIHSAGDVNICGGDMKIAAEDDGIHSDTAIAMSGGNVAISKCYEGVEAKTIDLSGGDLDIKSTDDGLNANGGGENGGFPDGPPGDIPPEMMEKMQGEAQERSEDGASEEDSLARETLKMLGDSEARKLAMEEKMMNAAGEEDVEAQEAESGSESAEAADGETQAPDAKPAPSADMKEGQEEGKEEGQEKSEEEEDMETWVHISGGRLNIENESGRDADGIDSNGDIEITGGVIRISMVNEGVNNAIDFGSENNKTCRINGGDLVACGGSGMLESISEDSTQGSLLYVCEEEQAAGSPVILKDKNGKELLSYEPPYSYSAIHLSCPEMVKGEAYILSLGGEEKEVTLESIATSIGKQEGPPGGMGGPGMGGPPGWGGAPDGKNNGVANSESDGAADGKNSGATNSENNDAPDSKNNDASDGAANSVTDDMSGGEANGATDSENNEAAGETNGAPEGMDGPPGGPPPWDESRKDAEEEEEEDEVEDTRVDVRTLGMDVWGTVVASCVALAAGFLFVMMWI